VDPWWRWQDPDRVMNVLFTSSCAGWISGALGDLESKGEGPGATEPPWRAIWQRHEDAAQGAIEETLAEDLARSDGGLSEPAIARHLFSMLPTPARVLVSSSMPIRDLEWFAPSCAEPPAVTANRGANGIDGVCSSALGMAAAGGELVVGLVGDLAFLHDLSSLVQPASAGSGAACVLIVVDNGGGGIFSFLPPRNSLPSAQFEHLFGTPQQVDIGNAAAGLGIEVARVSRLSELSRAIATLSGRSGPSVVHARVPGRDENVTLHEQIQTAVIRALRTLD
jgi:2-succinyl-5-enolpyruvyl-6-hydroxy-3-cyclohexene-1-carboxylate synthase